MFHAQWHPGISIQIQVSCFELLFIGDKDIKSVKKPKVREVFGVFLVFALFGHQTQWASSTLRIRITLNVCRAQLQPAAVQLGSDLQCKDTCTLLLLIATYWDTDDTVTILEERSEIYTFFWIVFCRWQIQKRSLVLTLTGGDFKSPLLWILWQKEAS